MHPSCGPIHNGSGQRKKLEAWWEGAPKTFDPREGVKRMASMNRKFIDCRAFPSEKQCTLAIAGTEEEVLTVAVRHAVQEHGHENTAELREQIRSMLKDE